MNIYHFKKDIIPELTDIKVSYRSYPTGDFGSLEQVLIEGRNKEAIMDIWSSGWLGLCIFDMLSDEMIMNILLDPTEEQEPAIKDFTRALRNEK